MRIVSETRAEARVYSRNIIYLGILCIYIIAEYDPFTAFLVAPDHDQTTRDAWRGRRERRNLLIFHECIESGI